ncbi:MAG: putative porin [Planctomycetota bacterium]|nr:putative porin [Planctomycetota bacterium]
MGAVPVVGLILALLCCAPLAAQSNLETDDDLKLRIQRLETELANLRDRVEERERASLDEELRSRTIAQVYGDIGLRYHMLFESQSETFNRPEFRVHLGVFGTAFNQDQQRLRYDVRMTTSALDPVGKPAPTLHWLPFPGYGVRTGVAFDRFLIDYSLNRTAELTMGRFPTPWSGTELLFDRDYHFQGLAESLRFDRFLPEAVSRILPRLQIMAVQGYLAQNNIGLPAPTAETQPIYLGAQFRMDFAPFERPSLTPEGQIAPEINSEFELRVVLGIHWFDGGRGRLLEPRRRLPRQHHQRAGRGRPGAVRVPDRRSVHRADPAAHAARPGKSLVPWPVQLPRRAPARGRRREERAGF